MYEFVYHEKLTWLSSLGHGRRWRYDQGLRDPRGPRPARSCQQRFQGLFVICDATSSVTNYLLILVSRAVSGVFDIRCMR